MNAPRHDPDQLKAALDAFAAAERKAAELEDERARVAKAIWAHGAVLNQAREAAAKLIAKEGGSVIHADQFWKTEDGRVVREPVRVNLDAIEEVRRHQATELHLTPPDSEKVA
jgi:hypothetical protein